MQLRGNRVMKITNATSFEQAAQAARAEQSIEEHLARMCTAQYVSGLEGGSFASKVQELGLVLDGTVSGKDYRYGTKIDEVPLMSSMLERRAFDLGFTAGYEQPMQNIEIPGGANV